MRLRSLRAEERVRWAVIADAVAHAYRGRHPAVSGLRPGCVVPLCLLRPHHVAGRVPDAHDTERWTRIVHDYRRIARTRPWRADGDTRMGSLWWSYRDYDSRADYCAELSAWLLGGVAQATIDRVRMELMIG